MNKQCFSVKKIMNKFALFALFVFTIVVVGLFIELCYNESHATCVVLAPETLIVIKAKELKQKNDIVIYNTKNTSVHEAMTKIPKSKQSKYHEQKIERHLSKKISEPFNNSYNEIKQSYAESMPVSFIYKTALSVVDVAHDLTTGANNESSYRMLVANEEKHTAFLDGANIYIK